MRKRDTSLPLIAFVAPATIALFLQCGRGPSTAPSATAPAITQVQIHIVGGHLKVGSRQGATSTVLRSDGTNTAVRPVWSSSNENVLTVDQDGQMSGIGPGVALIRATFMESSNEIPITVVSVTPPPGRSGSPAQAPVVISELRTRGRLGGNDEFVEVRNVSDAAISLTGWSLAFSTANGATITSGNVPAPTQVPPGCAYLFTGAGVNAYSDGEIAIGDFLYDAVLDDNGGVALVDHAGEVVDQVGFGPGSPYVEGSFIPSNPGGNHERFGADTNDNSANFRQPGGRPENSSSVCRSR